MHIRIIALTFEVLYHKFNIMHYSNLSYNSLNVQIHAITIDTFLKSL